MKVKILFLILIQCALIANAAAQYRIQVYDSLSHKTYILRERQSVEIVIKQNPQHYVGVVQHIAGDMILINGNWFNTDTIEMIKFKDKTAKRATMITYLVLNAVGVVGFTAFISATTPPSEPNYAIMIPIFYVFYSPLFIGSGFVLEYMVYGLTPKNEFYPGHHCSFKK